MFKRLFSRERQANRAITEALYARIVAAARQTSFYSGWNVPDTPLGRFEMLSLHMFLFQYRLRGEQGMPAELAQVLIDEFFLDVEHSLRELGVSDVGVPKRMKKLARMFYGRTAAYDEALDGNNPPEMAAALARNVRPDVDSWPESTHLALYVFAARDWLARQSSAEICAGAMSFPAAAGGEGGV